MNFDLANKDMADMINDIEVLGCNLNDLKIGMNLGNGAIDGCLMRFVVV